jgi:HEAT repeat protein
MARELAHAYGKKRRKIERKLQKRVALDPQQLEPLLRSPDEEIRRAASEVVEEMGPNAAPLAEVLGDIIEHRETGSYYSYEYWVKNALAAIGPAGVPVVLHLLGSSRPEVQQTAADVVAIIGPKASSASPLLTGMLYRQDDPQAALTAKLALQKIGLPAIDDLCSTVEQGVAATDGSASFQASRLAASTLADMNDLAQPAIPCLLRALQLSGPALQIAELAALGSIGQGSVGVAQALADHLEDVDSDIRQQAGRPSSSWAMSRKNRSKMPSLTGHAKRAST